MKKILIFSIFTILFLSNLCSQELQYKILKITGQVDIKVKDERWRTPLINQVIRDNTEIFTGFHSQITLETEKDSYITVNQLSHVKIDDILLNEGERITKVNLITGYVVVNAKDKNKIIVNLNKDHTEFSSSSGEVYYRKDKGAVIRSFSGKIKIGAKLSSMYFINKGEVCGILPSGKLLESDYFLRKEINTKPNNITDPQGITAYYDLLFQPYSSELETNDYSNTFRP